MEVIEVDSSNFNIISTCRCCSRFSSSELMLNIFDYVYDNIELHEILSLLVPVAISPDDGKFITDCETWSELQTILYYLLEGLSQSICDSCKHSAIDAYCFRQTCITTDENNRMNQAAACLNNDEEEEDAYEDDDLIAEINLEEATVESIIEQEEAYLSCKFCRESFQLSDELVDHIYTNHRIEEEADFEAASTFACHICNQRFTTLDNLENHISYSHHVVEYGGDLKKLKNNECFICGKKFPSPSKLSRHMIVHRDLIDPSEIPERPRRELKYQCMVCEKRVETPSKLKRHLSVHNKSGKYNGINQHRPFPCNYCELRFWDGIKLERHQVIHSEAFERSALHHPANHMFTCVICLAKLSDYDDCIEHMKGHREDYGENTAISCKLCDKSYPKLANLIRHSRSHAENATHQCVNCGKQMGMGDDFIDHLLRHQGFRPFMCDFQACGKSFLKLHKLRLHMTTHEQTTVKPFSCTQCEKSFSEIEYLKRHMLRHSGRKDHVCTVCPARFTFKSGLTSHLLTHSTVKSFSCDKCSAKFNKLQTLRTHQKIHVGDVSCWTINFYSTLVINLFSTEKIRLWNLQHAVCRKWSPTTSSAISQWTKTLPMHALLEIL